LNELKVSVLGSCRVYSPVTKAIDGKNFRSGHDKTEWFTHSTKDVIQKILILNNKITLPESYVPLVINDQRRYFPDIHRSNFFSDTNVFVIEISSIQSNNLNGYELQQWCVRDLKNSVDDECKKIANSVETKIMSLEEIIFDLNVIYDLLERRPIVLVSHNLLKKPDGSIPKPRPVIKKALEEFALNKTNVSVFDPTEVILKNGFDSAMKDVAHYKSEFEPVIGNEILRKVGKLVF
jgi:hypothetical protein